MKISQMTNDQAADAMVKMAEPIAHLMEDEATAKLLDDLKQGDKEGGIAFFGRMLPKVVPFCMKDHKADVYAIVAALTLKPISAVGGMNFVDTIKELRESIDEDFLGFFRSSGSATSKPGE